MHKLESVTFGPTVLSRDGEVASLSPYCDIPLVFSLSTC